nr:MAG TPA: hypothetical protein [Caudoviricetes sp.]
MCTPVVSSILLRQIPAMQADIAVFAVGIFTHFPHALAPLAVYGDLSGPHKIVARPLCNCAGFTHPNLGFAVVGVISILDQRYAGLPHDGIVRRNKLPVCDLNVHIPLLRSRMRSLRRGCLRHWTRPPGRYL